MKPRTEFSLIWFVIAIVVVLIAVSEIKKAFAVPYTSLPQSLDKIWIRSDGLYYAIIWEQTDNSYYCLLYNVENIASAPTYISGLPNTVDGETSQDYLTRSASQVSTRELTQEERQYCQAQVALIRPQWIVKQYRTYETRPVKRIVNGVVDTSDTIGRIAYGEPCGNEVESGTSTMWREVTIQYQEGPVVGAAVCEEAVQ